MLICNYFCEPKKFTAKDIDVNILKIQKKLNSEKYDEFLEDNMNDITKTNINSEEEIHINILFSRFSCMDNKCPSISYDDYIRRIFKYTNFNPSILILGVLYIKYVIYNYPYLRVDNQNKHRLIAISLLLAYIHLEDNELNYDNYCRVIGIGREELEDLLFNFLFLLDFKIASFDTLVIQYQDEFKVQKFK